MSSISLGKIFENLEKFNAFVFQEIIYEIPQQVVNMSTSLGDDFDAILESNKKCNWGRGELKK